jgi:hypothetical protein
LANFRSEFLGRNPLVFLAEPGGIEPPTSIQCHDADTATRQRSGDADLAAPSVTEGRLGVKNVALLTSTGRAIAGLDG